MSTLPFSFGIDYPEMYRPNDHNSDIDGAYRQLVTDSLRPTIKLFMLRSHGDEYFRWRYVREQLQHSVYHYFSQSDILGDDNWLCRVMLEHLEYEFRQAMEHSLESSDIKHMDDVEFTITPHYSFYMVEFKQRVNT